MLRTDLRSPTHAACDAPFADSSNIPNRAGWWRVVLGVLGLVLLTLRSSLAAEPQNVLLDFTATWCGPCQQMSSTVSRLERQGYSIRKVDVDKEPALAARFEVQSIPCFVLVANGKELDRVTGMTTEQQLRSMLQRLPMQVADATPRGGSTLANPELGQPIPLDTVPPKTEKSPKGILPRLFGEKKKEQPIQLAPAVEPLTIRGLDPENYAASASDPRLASVRLRVKDGSAVNFGSGTIIDSRPGRAVILTCGHLFRKLSRDATIEVDLFLDPKQARAETVLGQVLDFDLEADVGILTISCPQQLPFAHIGLSRGPLSRQEKVFSIGCSGGDTPSVEELALTAINKYDGPENLECTGFPKPGRSGGGLFRGDELVGVCIAADPKEKRGIYAGLNPVGELLEKVGLGYLAKQIQPTIKPDTERKFAGVGDTPFTPEQKAPAPNGDPSVDDIQRFLERELNVTEQSGAGSGSLDDAGSEIVCIIRSKTPGGPSRVVIINQASKRILADLLYESNNAASRTADLKPQNAFGTESNPVETSFAPEQYRRSNGK